MNESQYMAALALAGVGFGALLVWSWRSAVRQIRSTPLRGCGELVRGHACRVEGRLRTNTPLRAPLTNTPCAFYRIVANEHHRSSRGEDVAGHEVGRFEEGSSLQLVDETGAVDVDLSGCELHCTEHGADAESAFGEDRRELLERANQGFRESFGAFLDKGALGLDSSRIRLVESCVPLDVTIQARGKVLEGPAGPVLGGERDLIVCVPPHREGVRERNIGLVGVGIMLVCALLAAAALVAGNEEYEPAARTPAVKPLKEWKEPRR
jgi:hypothetical protein